MNYTCRIALLLVSVCLLTCTKKETTSEHFEARKYFSAYTSGLVNEDAVLTYRLLPNTIIDSVNYTSAFSFEPHIEADVTYNQGTHEINIQPDEPLTRGQKYQVTVDLGKCLVPSISQKIDNEIQVFHQNLDVVRQGLVIDVDESYTLVEVFTSLTETAANIESIFNLPPSEIEVDLITNYHFKVKLMVDRSNQSKIINWSGADIHSKDEGSISIYTYDPSRFEVVNTYYNRSEKAFKVYFSQKLKPNQDITGLVQLNGKAASVDIDQNVLTVYVTSNLKKDQSLTIESSLLSVNDLTLSSSLNYSIEIDIVKPEVEWVHSGTYIPATGDFNIPIKAKGLRSIHIQVIGMPSENTPHFSSWNELSNVDLMEIKRFGRIEISQEFELSNNSRQLEEWAEYGLDLTKLFQRKTGEIYTILLSFGPSNTILECSNSVLKEMSAPELKERFFDKPYDYYFYGHRYNMGYDYRERNNPCHASYYLDRQWITKNVLCTNVFPIIKSGGNDYHIAVKELMTNQVASQATLSLYNLQGMIIASGETSSEGLYNTKIRNGNPRALRIDYQNETSYYHINEDGALPLTEFDVSSNVRDIDNKIFVYTERDIWRPGDEVHVDIMLNASKFDFEIGLPIVVSFRNPKGVLHTKEIQHVSSNQIYSFTLDTDLESITGYWTAEIKIGPHSKSQSLRIETIKPNVVDLVFDIDKETDGWVYSDKLGGIIAVDYLAGFPLKKGKVSTTGIIRQLPSPFPEFKSYHFIASKVKPKKDVRVLSTTTDLQGKSSFTFSEDFTSMSGVSQIILDSKIDLPGGGLNTQTTSFIVSPYDSYVGIKRTQGRGWRGSYQYGETPKIQIVNLDKSGKKITGASVGKIEIYKYETDWWYDRYRLSRDNSYHTQLIKKLVHSETANFENGEYTFVHDVNELSSGSYSIVVTDGASKHHSERRYHCVTSDSYVSNINPELLQIVTDKMEYKIGDDILIELPNVPNSKALLSIEAGEKVHDIFWVDLASPSLRLKVKEEWAPNIYLSLHVVQPFDQIDNDRPMRMYAVKKVRIQSSDNNLKPLIDASEKTLPNAPLRLTVSEEEGHEMEYTIAVVDQGLLNITGFKTPSPRIHFNKMMALRVKTWDIFSQLMHVVNPSFAGIISIGGDEALNKMLDESADFNRFEPVVFHDGPFKLKSGETRNHEFELPNYIGRLRVMVVACNATKFGSADKNVKVASPIMIQSQLPRALNVTDTLDIPVTLFKDEVKINSAQLNAKAQESKIDFVLPNIEVYFDEGEQETVTLSAAVQEAPGSETLTFNASSGNFRSEEETKLFINYPNAYSSQVDYIEIEPGDSKVVNIDGFGYASTQYTHLTASGALMPDFLSHYQELLKYPHGCLEQLTSKGLSILYVNDLIQIEASEKKLQVDYIDAAIKKIQSYQNPNGKFKYWSSGYYNVWADIYAGYFLSRAKERGHMVSGEAIKKWTQHNMSTANSWRLEGVMSKPYTKELEETVQAFRLMTLAMTGSAPKGAMNRFRQRAGLSTFCKTLLGAAYGYAGLEDIAKSLLQSALNETMNSNYSYFGSKVRNQALLIAACAQWLPGQQLDRYYKKWVQDVNDRRWLSTHEMGCIFIACQSYLGDVKTSSEMDIALTSAKYNDRYKFPANQSRAFSWSPEDTKQETTIKNHGDSKIFLSILNRGISKELYESASNSNLSLRLIYSKEDGSDALTTPCRQGEEVTITATINNQSGIDLDYLALNIKAPSGWEIINSRVFETAALKSDSFDHQDFKDDKVYTYFKLSKQGENKTKTFRFKCRAQLNGNFYLPAVSVGDMYNLDVYAKSKAQRVIVE